MQTLGDGTNSLSRHRTTLQKVVETGFLSATWLALVSDVNVKFPAEPKLRERYDIQCRAIAAFNVITLTKCWFNIV